MSSTCKVLFQACRPDARLLEISRGWHDAYCARHNIRHEVKVSSFVSRYEKWRYLGALARELPDDARIYYLDEDCLINMTHVPLDEMLPPGFDLALPGWPHMPGYSSGVMGMRVSQRLREFIDSVIERQGKAVPAPWDATIIADDEIGLNLMLPFSRLWLWPLSSRWNCPYGAPGSVIHAWHGIPLDVKELKMSERLKELEAAHACA